MKKSWFCWLAALLPACTDMPVDEPSLASPCAGAPITNLGIGQPCRADADCATLQASRCLTIAGADSGFCSKTCIDKPQGWLACGPGAQCVTQGTSPAMCAPVACAPTVQIDPPFIDIDRHCTVGQVNDLGVGKVCTSVGACAAFGGSTACPDVLHPGSGAPAFCSPLCGQDADCGPNAFCFWRKAAPGKENWGWIGACAPVACKLP